METQNYKNHVRYYTPHHFVFYPVMLAMMVFSFWCGFKYPEQQVIWWFLTAVVTAIALLSFMLRQHYALTNQNRIVKLEMQFRYYVLTNERLELLEDKLSDSQVFALRFASDAELPGLVKRAVDEKLSADEIKKAIVEWVGDYRRV